MSSQLVGSDFTGATQLPNYVNGRLLTAEDLATSQATLQAGDGMTGQAAGHGVVTGLWVTSTATTLTVAPGLGIAPSGAAISVGASVTLPLIVAPPTTGSTIGASFSCCTQAPGATGTPAIAVGCYLLTALPAAQLAGQAPLASPPDSTMPSGCTAQWQMQGTQFKAITLSLPSSVWDQSFTDDNRRNLLAHWCFGSQQLQNLGASPLDFPIGYSGFDTLDPSDLTAGDVPLAVFYWDGQTVGFVDNWSARRRVTAPDPVGVTIPGQTTASWSAVVADRRTADGQARFLQFQDQAAELIVSGAAATVAAADTFPLLPPVGFLPIGSQQVIDLMQRLRKVAEQKDPAERVPGVAPSPEVVLRSVAALSPKGLEAITAAAAVQGPQPGFDPYLFFGAEAYLGGVVDWEVADLALRQSWENLPALVTTQPPPDHPPVYVFYLVLQNYLAWLEGSPGPNLCVVFIKNYTWVGAQSYTWIGGTSLPVVPPYLPRLSVIRG
jgi:hypothetical protein